MNRRLIAALVIGLLFAGPGLLPGAASAQIAATVPIDCEGPELRDPAPGSTEWRIRDLENVYCGNERRLDFAEHPNSASQPVPGPTNDAYRSPVRHDGIRFRYHTATVGNIAAEIYRPCTEDTCSNMPAHLETFDPPYPAITISHGCCGSRKEFHWWGAQMLAEAGYLVINLDSTGGQGTALSWLLNPDNPLSAEVDVDRIGITGHSAGGGSATGFGQGSDLVSAIVSWDANTGSVGEGTTPHMWQVADYTSPTWVATPSASPPNPNRGAGGYPTLRDRGVDTMRVSLRAGMHFDWMASTHAGSRYGEAVNGYYTLAWFDRYLKGKLTGEEGPEEKAMREAIARNAHRRLTADFFDDSYDRHNISQGFWSAELAVASGDPLYGGNVAYLIAGKPVADRLSFYLVSACSISDPDTGDRVRSDDMRTEGCKPSD